MSLFKSLIRWVSKCRHIPEFIKDGDYGSEYVCTICGAKYCDSFGWNDDLNDLD